MKFFTLVSLISVLSTSGAIEKPLPRNLAADANFPTGASFNLDIIRPATNAEFQVNEQCTASVLVEAIAEIGEGLPDVTYVYVVDSSGSIGFSSGLNDAIISFYSRLTDVLIDSPSTKNTAVVDFADSASTLLSLTEAVEANKDTINAAVENREIGGLTCCSCGVNQAFGTISAPPSAGDPSTRGNNVVLIFLGDGACNRGGSVVTQFGASIISVAVGGISCSVYEEIPGRCVESENPRNLNLAEVIGTKFDEMTLAVKGMETRMFGFPSEYTAESKTAIRSASFSVGPGSYTAVATVTGDDLDPAAPITLEDTQAFSAIDASPPTVSCPSDMNVGTDSGLCSATVLYSGESSDNCGVASTSLVPPSGSTFELTDSVNGNAFDITYTATDTAGLVSECGFSVVVTDNEPPSVECRFGVNPGGNENTASQDGFFELLGWDNCDASGNSLEYFIVDKSNPDLPFGPFPQGSTFKYVKAPGAPLKEKPASGDVDWKITGNGDPSLAGVDGAGNRFSVDCVPMPPVRHRDLLRGHA